MATPDKTSSSDCRKLEEDLVLYHYRELSDTARAHVEAHLRDCEFCRASLDEMGKLLPMTVLPDDPPQAFWDAYSREMRHKLAEKRETYSWWRRLGAYFQPWTLPAMATAAVVVLALTLTFGKGWWRAEDAPQQDELLMELLPVAENLEFFRTMEVLDALDLLEFMSSQGNGKA